MLDVIVLAIAIASVVAVMIYMPGRARVSDIFVGAIILMLGVASDIQVVQVAAVMGWFISLFIEVKISDCEYSTMAGYELDHDLIISNHSDSNVSKRFSALDSNDPADPLSLSFETDK
jgi:hypothetical protein